jgi:multisubunit Na+/H+ antiporter MnhC subunit
MTSDPAQFFWLIFIFVISITLVGLYCVLVTYNLLRLVIGLEVLIKAATLFIIANGYLSGQISLAQALVITIIVVEVVMVIVAAGIVLAFFKEYDSLNIKNARNLKG